MGEKNQRKNQRFIKMPNCGKCPLKCVTQFIAIELIGHPDILHRPVSPILHDLETNVKPILFIKQYFLFVNRHSQTKPPNYLRSFFSQLYFCITQMLPNDFIDFLSVVPAGPAQTGL